MAEHLLIDGKELTEFHILHCLFTQLLLKLFKLSVFQFTTFLSFTLPPPLCLPMEEQHANSCVVLSCQLHEPHQPSRDPGCSKNYRTCDTDVEDTRLGSWQDLGKMNYYNTSASQIKKHAGDHNGSVEIHTHIYMYIYVYIQY